MPRKRPAVGAIGGAMNDSARRDKYRFFISCASVEFMQLRKEIYLIGGENGYAIVIQDRFEGDPGYTLGYIAEKIAECDEVVHVVGGDPGSVPKNFGAWAAENPGLVAAAKEHMHSDGYAYNPNIITYTQWEYWFARVLGKPIHVVCFKGWSDNFSGTLEYLRRIGGMGRWECPKGIGTKANARRETTQFCAIYVDYRIMKRVAELNARNGMAAVAGELPGTLSEWNALAFQLCSLVEKGLFGGALQRRDVICALMATNPHLQSHSGPSLEENQGAFLISNLEQMTKTRIDEGGLSILAFACAIEALLRLTSASDNGTLLAGLRLWRSMASELADEKPEIAAASVKKRFCENFAALSPGLCVEACFGALDSGGRSGRSYSVRFRLRSGMTQFSIDGNESTFDDYRIRDNFADGLSRVLARAEYFDDVECVELVFETCPPDKEWIDILTKEWEIRANGLRIVPPVAFRWAHDHSTVKRVTFRGDDNVDCACDGIWLDQGPIDAAGAQRVVAKLQTTRLAVWPRRGIENPRAAVESAGSIRKVPEHLHQTAPAKYGIALIPRERKTHRPLHYLVGAVQSGEQHTKKQRRMRASIVRGLNS